MLRLCALIMCLSTAVHCLSASALCSGVVTVSVFMRYADDALSAPTRPVMCMERDAMSLSVCQYPAGVVALHLPLVSPLLKWVIPAWQRRQPCCHDGVVAICLFIVNHLEYSHPPLNSLVIICISALSTSSHTPSIPFSSVRSFIFALTIILISLRLCLPLNPCPISHIFQNVNHNHTHCSINNRKLHYRKERTQKITVLWSSWWLALSVTKNDIRSNVIRPNPVRPDWLPFALLCRYILCHS